MIAVKSGISLNILKVIYISMKNKLRCELIRRRNNISESKLLIKSNEIKKKLFNLVEFKRANTILFYISHNNEVYTHDMIKECMSNRKRIIVPISNKKNQELLISEIRNWRDLKRGSYNILEPKNCCIYEYPIELIDIIIVPGVGFDKKGGRIGHGCGYYDKLLKYATSPIIGLAFNIQLVENIPIEKHDIRVDKIITEYEIIKCKI